MEFKEPTYLNPRRVRQLSPRVPCHTSVDSNGLVSRTEGDVGLMRPASAPAARASSVDDSVDEPSEEGSVIFEEDEDMWLDEDEDEDGEYVDIELDQDGPTGRMSGPGLRHMEPGTPVSMLTPCTLPLTMEELLMATRSLKHNKLLQGTCIRPPRLRPEHILPGLSLLISLSEPLATQLIRSFTPTSRSDWQTSPPQVLPLFGISTASGGSVSVQCSSFADRQLILSLQRTWQLSPTLHKVERLSAEAAMRSFVSLVRPAQSPSPVAT